MSKTFITFEDGAVARTTTLNVERGIGPARNFSFYLDVTAASGTSPTLDVDIQEYDEASDKWFTAASFTQATAVTNERITSVINGARVRALMTIGGTSPSFTFTLSGAGAE